MVGVPPGSTNFTDLVTSTVRELQHEIADGLLHHNALLYKLRMRNNVQPFGGGRYITQNLSYGDNGSFGWYTGSDDLGTTQNNTLTAATYSLRQSSTSCQMTGLDQMQNMGESEVLDLAQHRAMASISTHYNKINSNFWRTTASSTAVNSLIYDMLPATNNTGTFGGIDRTSASNDYWRHYVGSIDFTGADAAAITNATNASGNAELLYNALTRAKIQQTRNSDAPDTVFIGSVGFELLQYYCRDKTRFMGDGGDSQRYRLNFDALRLNGMDIMCSDGLGEAHATGKTQDFLPIDGVSGGHVAVILNTKYLHWRYHKDRNFVMMTPENRWIYNKDVEYNFILFAGNLTSSGNKFHGVLIES